MGEVTSIFMLMFAKLQYLFLSLSFSSKSRLFSWLRLSSIPCDLSRDNCCHRKIPAIIEGRLAAGLSTGDYLFLFSFCFFSRHEFVTMWQLMWHVCARRAFYQMEVLSSDMLLQRIVNGAVWRGILRLLCSRGHFEKVICSVWYIRSKGSGKLTIMHEVQSMLCLPPWCIIISKKWRVFCSSRSEEGRRPSERSEVYKFVAWGSREDR